MDGIFPSHEKEKEMCQYEQDMPSFPHPTLNTTIHWSEILFIFWSRYRSHQINSYLCWRISSCIVAVGLELDFFQIFQCDFVLQ